MAKGFLSFALVAIFVFALFSSAAQLRSSPADRSYEAYRAFDVHEIAIKRMLYAAVSEAASQAIAASAASGAGQRQGIYLLAHQRAVEAEGQLRSLGYDVIFWCGSPSEQARLSASEEMLLQKRALLPEGATPLMLCAGEMDSGIASRRLHFFSMGFSYYSPALGLGKAAVLPEDYEVDF